MPLQVFTGLDPKDIDAAHVFVWSLLTKASVEVNINVIKDHELRREGIYWRRHYIDERGQMFDFKDGKPFSTLFSFTRFAIPFLVEPDLDDWVLWCDPDTMFRADVAELFSLVKDDNSSAIYCVKHKHEPEEGVKMGGAVIQQPYFRKNWSSVMLLRPRRLLSLGFTKYALNNWRGSDLHALRFCPDELIGGLPEEWNWLAGHSSQAIEPKLVHYTLGTPDMPGCEDAPYANEWRRHFEAFEDTMDEETFLPEGR